MSNKAADLTGQRFGMLTVVGRAGSVLRPSGRLRCPIWTCLCDCGLTGTPTSENLRTGNTTSCGCQHGEQHGGRHAVEYEIWCSMRARCDNPKNKAFHNYGGRGIGYDPAWVRFSQFIADVGPRPSDLHSLDRRDNEKGYSKDNCRWATKKEQCNNRRGNRLITALGKTQTLMQWADETGIPQGTIRFRIESLWLPDEAVSMPVRKVSRAS